MVVTGRWTCKPQMPVCRLEVELRAMTGDLLYFLAFGLLAALVVVPAVMLIRKASPRHGRRLRRSGDRREKLFI